MLQTMQTGYVEENTRIVVLPRAKGGTYHRACMSGHRGLGAERAYYEMLVPGIPNWAILLFCDRSEIVNFANLQHVNTRDDRWNEVLQWANGLPDQPR